MTRVFLSKNLDFFYKCDEDNSLERMGSRYNLYADSLSSLLLDLLFWLW